MFAGEAFVADSGTTHLTQNRVTSMCGQADVPDTDDECFDDVVGLDDVEDLRDVRTFCDRCTTQAGLKPWL